MKIKTIIYDYGGVIMTSAQEEAVRRFSEIGIVPDLMPLDKYNQQGVFLALEDGSITADEFRDSHHAIFYTVFKSRCRSDILRFNPADIIHPCAITVT